ncbi:fructokinase [Alteribacter lacisalsi]|uniref:fructokinase n=1 Tax=Alteribacter lacisalsi TaxID=2045244 RepID=A0A2W0H6X7_9BACI|nr:ROK family protein [Alteribacter lacisalsi]PYZ97604.1 fructokinase [Alteribacter lacisalsi]
MLIGAIEAGGTKFVCAVGYQNGDIVEKITIPTREPNVTLPEADRFFSSFKISKMGIGSFGPVHVDRKSTRYGEILETPKQSWRGVNMVRHFTNSQDVPVHLDTDVNASALGEYVWGAGKGKDSCLYITVGTGIGAGFVKDGLSLNGRLHPEMGHIPVERHEEDSFEGCCPYHGNCLEGLASGTAIRERYGREGKHLSDSNEVWEMEAFYLAQAVASYLYVLCPDIVIIGGGVPKQKTLLPLVRKKAAERINGYVNPGDFKEWIVSPALNDEQGIKGAMALAIEGKR